MHDCLMVKGRRYERFHVVQNVDRNAGFSALMTYALNGVRKAVEQNWLPVVNFDSTATHNYYDPEYGENVWEYYFCPVMGVSYGQLKQWVDEGKVATDLVHSYSDAEILNRHLLEPDRLATFWTHDKVTDPREWMASKRRLGRDLVSRYIKLKPHIIEKFETLHAKLIKPKLTFGVHIRGTDFAYAEPTLPEAYFLAIVKKAAQLDAHDFNIFVATDQQQFLDTFRNEFPGRVVSYDAARSDNDIAPFQLKTVRQFLKAFWRRIGRVFTI